ncbi:Membrane protein involved in the export of O-antigen and teichoic acid [Formosa sp. Hel1_31_208]|uniref:lipopolysaccharide biosynthesis protein n=1 Tax=Formosa sp. Hel1_31_208 TaxID=1798225 RepID=UPI00087B3CA8|nr:oligosaccharide flippase family protein [Formosa sp. Hel1_31_208]SDS37663.1 Membrane protein involved in the export of O-antigen and teichoic acid [Formosa sp. Hel1_31_208]
MNIDRDTIQKILTLYGSTFIGIGLGFAISIFNTRVLGKEAFGDFKFIETVFRFLASLVSIGVFISITRMLAIARDKIYKHNLIGFFVIALATAGLIGIILLIIFSYIEPIWFSNNLGSIFRKYSFLIFAILGTIALKEILKGLNKIYALSFLNAIPALAYLVIAYTYNLDNALYLEDIFLLLYGLQFICMIAIIYKLKPKFNIKKSLVKDVIHENNTNGRPIYYGSLAGVATAHIVGFSLSYYIDNTQVGFFTLALTICSPLIMIPSVLGTVLFKKFANFDYIPKKVFLFSILASAVALVIFFLFIEKVFLLFYSDDFSPTIAIAKLLILSFLLHGLGDLINRFLGAKGQGKLIRNSAFMVGIVNILGYTILVNYFGVNGAIITKILASGTYLIMMYYYYTKFTKKNKYV